MVLRGRRQAMVAVGALVLLLVQLAGCTSSGASRSRGATGATEAGGGSSKPSATLHVVASTDVYGDLAKQVGGDEVRVTSIITDPDADPHSYEANTQNQLALSRADVVIENGGGYDDFIDTMLRAANNPDADVINAVDISHLTAPAGGELNEHVWYDVGTVERLVDRLAAVLSAGDRANATTFATNAASFKAKLHQLASTEASIKAAHSGEGVAITEPVPLYMLEACGLDNKTPSAFSEAIEDGTDVPPAAMQATLDLFGDNDVKLLAYNEQTSGPETERVLRAARASGVAVVPVTETLPAGKDYLAWMRDNLAAIQTALA